MISANLTKEVRKAVYKRDGYTCALCDSPRGLQVHHAIPRSEGGGTATTTSSPFAGGATPWPTGPACPSMRTGWILKNCARLA